MKFLLPFNCLMINDLPMHAYMYRGVLGNDVTRGKVGAMGKDRSFLGRTFRGKLRKYEGKLKIQLIPKCRDNRKLRHAIG